MAPRQITDILVRLGIEGLQGLDKVSSAFKDLQKTLDGPTTASIEKIRKSINEYGNASARTEQLIKGQLEALKGLKTQVDVTSVTYKKLNEDINRLETEMRGSTAAIDQQRQSILAAASAGEKNIQAIRSQITALDRLRQQTRPGSSAFAQLSKDIDTARAKITGLASDAQDFSRALTGIPGASLDILGKQISNNRRAMQGLRIESDEFLSRLERISLLTARRDTLTGRQQVRASAAMYESPEYQGFVAERASRLGLPQTRAAFSQRTTEIQAELQNLQATESNLERILSLRKELRSIKQEENALTKQIKLAEEDTLDIVNRRINAQREVAQASGFREFSAGVEGETAIAKSVRRARERLERENDRLRKEAAEAITISSTPLLPAAGGTGGVIAPGAVMGGGARAAIGRGTEITTGTPFTRRPFVQANLPTAATGVAPAVGGRLAEAYDGVGRAVDRARRPLREIFTEISRTQQASNGSVNSLQAQISAWTELRNAVNASAPAFATATKNIEQLSRRQEALTGRGRITPGQAVQTAGAVISGGIFGGPEGFLGGLGGAALGAAVPALGVVGGAFAGSAAGAQLGMFRQQIAGTANYAAEIGKLQIALRGILGNQNAYNTAIASAAAVTRDLNIPQAEATRGLTRLSAAVLGAGGTVNDSAFAFRAMSEAVKATGGNAEQVDGALLALTQVFSKGKVSAEELNQIAERLPGTFTLFAQAAGKNGPELQKALEQGQVGLNDLMKFLELLGGRYSNTALKIASSSEDAGARLQVAFDEMRLQVGRAIQPIGAEIQDAFADFLVEITPALVEATRLVGEGFKYLAENTSKDVDNFRVALELLAQVGSAINPLGTAIQFLNQTLTDLGVSIKLSIPDIAAGMQMLLRSINPVQTALEYIIKARQLLGMAPPQPSPAATRKSTATGSMPRPGRFPEPQGAGNAEKEARRREKEEARERKNLFSELLSQLNAQNAVLAKQGRLNESIAESETAKVAAAFLTAEEILRNEQAQLDLRLKFGEVSKKVYDEQQKAIKLEGQTVRQEFDKTVKKLKEEADALLKEVTGPGGVAGPTETPLQRASREITEDIAKRRARALQIGGVAGQAAFEGLGALDVRQIASRQVAGPMIADLEKQIQDLQRMGKELSTLDQLKQEFLGDWERLDPVLRRQLELLAAQKDALVQQTQAAKDMKQLYSDIGMSIKDGVVSAIQGAIDGTKTLQQVASDLLSSIANRLLDVAVNLLLFGVMSGTGTGGGLLGGLFKPNAMGNAYAKNGIVPFAYGGVVNRPTLFPFAKGIGLMGEAGPEAILPLRRGSDGRLGVSSSGGGSTVVNVSVDASGTAVEGNGPGANQMGRIIGAAVQAEIVKMQRPGGLLANTR